MCGIIGYFNSEDAVSNIIKGLNIIKERGLDNYGISNFKEISYSKNINKLKIPKDKNLMGHCLHAVVSHIKQPIKEKGILVSNCEIYNWKELSKDYNINSKNDSELLIKLIEKIGIEKTIEKLDGVYAFAYWINNIVYIARDIIGEKPVWYDNSNGFSFASEKKALNKNAKELNPRGYIEYNIKTNKLKFIKRKFFSIKPTNKKSKAIIKKDVKELLLKAIIKRIPEKKLGILFSGGVDSTFLAKTCKDLGVKFTCYSAALEEKGLKSSEDVKYAKIAAKKLGFKLKIKTIKLKDVDNYLKKIVPLIEDSNPVKVGVALTFYTALNEAKKDGIKVMFSGLGSEEIFAGYERHKKSSEINKECLSGLRKMYERDLYRDDVISMNNNIEMRNPFLDKELVDYCLKIPEKYKINDGKDKLILREIADEIGLPKEIAYRKKRAAQYGSNFDKALNKLSKKNKQSKSEYLKQFYNPENLKLGALYSSGKDSNYALYIMKKQNYDIKCLITIDSKNKDSFMFHTPNIDMVDLQSKALGIPLIKEKTQGKKGYEIKDMERALKKAKEKYAIEGIITGALFSDYQRSRIEKACDKLGLKVFSPLWHKDQEEELKELIKNNFKVIISSIAAEGLNKNWVGKEINDSMINELVKLNKKYGLNIAGEGGEYESLVLNMPLFNKKLKIIDSKIKMESENIGKLLIKKAKLE